MRALILIAGTALALGGCRNNDQAGNTVNLDQALTAENIASNDVTAIDAVTGADANMAADVNYIEPVDVGSESGNGSPGSSRKSTAGSGAAASNAAEPPTAPARNAAASATANNPIQGRPAPGHHHQPALLARPPQRRDMVGKRVGALELATARAVGADKVGVAEIALRGRSVGFPARPQIAAGKAQEHRPAARLHALALQGQKRFLDRVGHA